eukprot:gene15227-18607_t
MPRLLRLFLKILAVLALILAAAGIWKRDEIGRLLAVNSLFEADQIVQNFSQMDQLFLTRPLSRGEGPVSPLPKGPEATLAPEAQAWIKDRSVTAMVVLKTGQMVHEGYHLGTGPEDL